MLHNEGKCIKALHKYDWQGKGKPWPREGDRANVPSPPLQETLHMKSRWSKAHLGKPISHAAFPHT